MGTMIYAPRMEETAVSIGFGQVVSIYFRVRLMLAAQEIYSLNDLVNIIVNSIQLAER
jgi:hypothetical protein